MDKILEIACKCCLINTVGNTWFLNVFDYTGEIGLNLKRGDQYTKVRIRDGEGTFSRDGVIELVNVIPSPIAGSFIVEYKEINADEIPDDHVDVQYLKAATDIITNGSYSENRTATNTVKLFGHMMKFDLRKGFPLLTTKKVDIDNIERELIFLMRGMSNIAFLKEGNCNIWNEWATDEGELGPVYGVQWRSWEDTRIVNGSSDQAEWLRDQALYEDLGPLENNPDMHIYRKTYDQLGDVINSLKTNPNDRRMLVTGLNPGYTPLTSFEFKNEQDRYDYALELRTQKNASDEDFLENFEEEPTELELMNQAQEAARNELNSLLDSAEGNSLDEKMDALGLPNCRPFSPKENAAVGQQALPPCHMIFQLGTTPIPLSQRIIDFMQDRDLEPEMWNDMVAKQMVKGSYTQEQAISDLLKGTPEYYIDMCMYQRSADWFLGVPYNIASYAMMLMIFAELSNMVPRNFCHMFGDYHVYENHLPQFRIQLEQDIKPMPKMELKDLESLDDLESGMFTLIDYDHGPILRGKVAV